jgi:gas vesicle protein
MSSGKVLLGVLAGVAAGALIGVLFAPDKGSVTRSKISKKGEDYADSLKDKFDEFIDGITAKFEKAKEDISDFAHDGNVKAEQAEKEVKSASR